MHVGAFLFFDFAPKAAALEAAAQVASAAVAAAAATTWVDDMQPAASQEG